MSPATLAAVATAALTVGVLLIVVGVAGTRSPAKPLGRGRSRLAALVGVGLPSGQRRTRRAIALLAAAATVLGWWVTGWPMGGLISGLAVVGVPWLLSVGSAERQAITRLEAVETWTRRLKDLVRTGHGLVSGVVASARTAPAPIAAQVGELAAALQAGADPQHALDRFADELADFTADQVIAALKLHINDRGQRLSDVLASVAESAGREVVMRRGIAAKRAEPRFVTRFMTALILIVLVVVFTNGAYSRPYAQPLGQLVLFAATLLLVGLLVWIRQLTTPPRQQRFLHQASASVSADSAPLPLSATGPREAVRP